MVALIRRRYELGHFFLPISFLEIPEGPIRVGKNVVVYGTAMSNLERLRGWYKIPWHDKTLGHIPSEERALKLIELLQVPHGELFRQAGTRPVYCQHGYVQYKTGIEATLSSQDDRRIRAGIAAFLSCDPAYVSLTLRTW